MKDIKNRNLEVLENPQGSKQTFTASAISLGSQGSKNDIYMSVSMRMFTANKPNLNGAVVTEDFIDEIVYNQEKYRCIPLCADVKKLESGDYDG